jgi:heterotetrameric sarcosine oxidase gamma subunit
MDLSKEALPFMHWAEGTLGGFPARVFRISFSGELSYEVAVPASQGRAFWDALLDAGDDLGVMPYGTEALHVMRAEKGFIMIGDETDGTVIPQDLGLGWAMSKKKADFLGKRGQERAEMTAPDRWRLVGLETVDGSVLPDGAYAVAPGRNANGQRNVQGRVTSTYHSPTLGRGIAMGLIRAGPSGWARCWSSRRSAAGRSWRGSWTRCSTTRRGSGRMSEAASALPGAVFEGSVRVAESGLLGMVTLRGDLRSEPVARAVKAAMGVAVPGQRRMEMAEDRGALWMSPDELLLIMPHGRAGAVVAGLSTALAGVHHLAVDVSDARALFRLTGDLAMAREVLATAHAGRCLARGVRPGRGAAHEARAGCGGVLDRRGRREHLCFRSVARYVFDLLANAAAPEAAVGYWA